MEYSKEFFTFLTFIIGTGCGIPYIIGIVKGKTKPHLFSWLIWAIICVIGASIQFAEGGGIGSFYLFYNAIYCLGIAVASYWRGTKDITRSDWVVLFIALTSIPLWMLTKQPIWSLFIIICIDGMAYFPTIRKSWLRPEEEVAFSWFMGGVIFLLVILSLETYTITTYLYPLVFLIINTGFGIMLIVRRKVLKLK